MVILNIILFQLMNIIYEQEPSPTYLEHLRPFMEKQNHNEDVIIIHLEKLNELRYIELNINTDDSGKKSFDDAHLTILGENKIKLLCENTFGDPSTLKLNAEELVEFNLIKKIVDVKKRNIAFLNFIISKKSDVFKIY